MDATELQIIAALRANARTSLLALAKELRMPHSTVHDKARRQRGKAIIRHTTLLDFAQLGYARAYLAIKTTPDGRKRTQEYLSGHRRMNNLHTINSGYDFLAEVIGKDTKEIEDIVGALRALPDVSEVQKFTILNDIASEQFVPGRKP